jgi:hypothetical protein
MYKILINILFILLLLSCNKNTWWSTEKEILKTEIAQLDSDYNKVLFIRNYVASNISYGNMKEYENDSVALHWKDCDMNYFQRHFQNDSISLLCGNTNRIALRIYEELGFKGFQYTYESDFSDPCAHTFNVIYINTLSKGEVPIMVDAYTCLQLMDSINEPKNFLEFLLETDSGNYTNSFLQMDSVDSKNAIVLPKDLSVLNSPGCTSEKEYYLPLIAKYGNIVPWVRCYENSSDNRCISFEDRCFNIVNDEDTLRMDFMKSNPSVHFSGEEIDGVSKAFLFRDRH